jgi:NTE family protein
VKLAWGKWLKALRQRQAAAQPQVLAVPTPMRLGLALGGGFARGMAHIGVLQVLERNNIAVDCIAGVSAGAIVAAAYASGARPEEIAEAGCAMRFGDVARWTIGRMGFALSERMERFLRRVLKCYTFEQMRVPLGVIATDLVNGEAVVFRDRGDVVLPIRASCSYPGLFQPLRFGERLLVDGAISMEVPALLTRLLGATHVISSHLPMQGEAAMPSNVFHVINRCFQILHSRTEMAWRQHSNLVIEPDVRNMEWDSFESGMQLIKAGADAALPLVPQLQSMLGLRAAQIPVTPDLISVSPRQPGSESYPATS